MPEAATTSFLEPRHTWILCALRNIIGSKQRDANQELRSKKEPPKGDRTKASKGGREVANGDNVTLLMCSIVQRPSTPASNPASRLYSVRENKELAGAAAAAAAIIYTFAAAAVLG